MATAQEIVTILEFDPKDAERVARRPQKPLEIVEYNKEWPAKFADVESIIRGALGNRVVLLQHVGSTSVPGLAAKDIIDIDLEVADPADEDSYVPDLKTAGFQLLFREPKWYNHRFFHLEDPYTNLHVFGPGCPEAARHRMFRDWLREHEDDRQLYAESKREAASLSLAANEGTMEYTYRKEPVVRDILRRMFEAFLNSPAGA
ncbi:GrpB domain protein [Astrocystis sublimbata]|nr:GrpB domain protein [Astrocystis sublimbata]